MSYTRTCIRLVLVAAAVINLVSVSSADILIRGYTTETAARYDRFANSSEFIGGDLDFSGVGQDATGANCWATMISPHFFLSAGHYQPTGTVTFYNTNSLSGGSHQYTIRGGTQICITGQSLPTDIYVGVIDSSVSAGGIAYYPILDQDMVSPGQSLLVYGKPNRLGTNTIATTTYFDLQNGGGTTLSRTYGYEFLYPESGSPDDAHLVSGDSGGPTFANLGNQLALVGTHSGADTSSGYPYSSLDSSPSFYINEINAAMASLAVLYGVGAGEHATVVVPEPCTIAMLLGLAAMMFVGVWRRTRKAS